IWLWVSTSSTLAAGLAVGTGRLRRHVRGAEEVARGAQGRAQRRLRGARGKREADPRTIYGELQKIIVDYLSERFSISAGTPRERLAELLRESGVADQAIDGLLAELDNCDFARFAPAADRELQAQNSIHRIEAVLGDIER